MENLKKLLLLIQNSSLTNKEKMKWKNTSKSFQQNGDTEKLQKMLTFFEKEAQGKAELEKRKSKINEDYTKKSKLFSQRTQKIQNKYMKKAEDIQRIFQIY